MLRHAKRAAALVVVALAACVPQQRQIKSNALDFLYPSGREAAPATDVRLTLPVRVGLAFAPSTAGAMDTFTETQKQQLLSRGIDAFRDRAGIGSVQAIPSSFLEPGGGFANLDRIASAFGIDLAVLISYDQFQFSETGRSSWAYWTLIGAYVVKGEKNETRTMMDAVVYDIPSRALLFNASGQNSVRGKSTPVDASRVLRERSEDSFRLATDDLIANLDTALDAFEDQAATGTVRGAGTPAIAMKDAQGRTVTPGQGGGGAGSLGPFALILAGALAGVAAARRRSVGR